MGKGCRNLILSHIQKNLEHFLSILIFLSILYTQNQSELAKAKVWPAGELSATAQLWKGSSTVWLIFPSRVCAVVVKLRNWSTLFHIRCSKPCWWWWAFGDHASVAWWWYYWRIMFCFQSLHRKSEKTTALFSALQKIYWVFFCMHSIARVYLHTAFLTREKYIRKQILFPGSPAAVLSKCLHCLCQCCAARTDCRGSVGWGSRGGRAVGTRSFHWPKCSHSSYWKLNVETECLVWIDRGTDSFCGQLS